MMESLVPRKLASYVQVDKDCTSVVMTVNGLKVLKPLTMFLYTLDSYSGKQAAVSLVMMDTSMTKILGPK